MILFKKNKYKKYKSIIFIDAENVGLKSLPTFPKTSYVFLFVGPAGNSKRILNTLTSDNIKIIYLDKDYIHSKNALDFCLVSQLSQVITEISKKQELLIISKDKGYDNVIRFLSQKYPENQVKRYNSYQSIAKNTGLVGNEFEGQPIEIVERILKYKIQDKVVKYNTMSELKKYININTYMKVFMIRKFRSLYVEYDIYTKTYFLYKLSASHKSVYISKNKDREEIVQNFQDECLNRYGTSLITTDFYAEI